jgi:hypothetical protein
MLTNRSIHTPCLVLSILFAARRFNGVVRIAAYICTEHNGFASAVNEEQLLLLCIPQSQAKLILVSVHSEYAANSILCLSVISRT